MEFPKVLYVYKDDDILIAREKLEVYASENLVAVYDLRGVGRLDVEVELVDFRKVEKDEE